MKARPIIFSAPMVRALLEGRKTQTRRLFKEKVSADCIGFSEIKSGEWVQCWRSFPEAENHPCEGMKAWSHKCPYGQRGDLLWVRESIGRKVASFLGIEATNGVESAFYIANGDDVVNEHDFNLCPWWKNQSLPSIHMPRGLSRLTLEITGVRVERLQDISADDCIAEGLEVFRTENAMILINGCFVDLWEASNGAGSWDNNPWVWVLEFEVHHCNVDDFLKARAA